MGWLHTFNLKRKVVGALTRQPGQSQSAAAIARVSNADEREVEQLLATMEQVGYVVSARQGSESVYRLNQAQETVGKVLHAFETEQEANDGGLVLRREHHDWTAELPNPAGMLVRGQTREEARERGLAMMKRMAEPTPAPTQPELGSGQV
ncbi:hypothetical protein [Terriglobus sp.]|uniref:hypothetical protein n=1 Tax=Terriglobus sp. TaxID=1889013 RepID=UPI003AFF8219